MNEAALKEKFEDLNMTKDEIHRFSEAMKKEEFRKLLVEYAQEISDPKNREIYEKEITQLEEERGMNVTFIHPEPGFCMKTTQSGDKKCFINVCKNSNIDRPTSSRQMASLSETNFAIKNRLGLMWHIPHTCSPPREDFDKSGKQSCIVYDVVFHPDSYRMGETNVRFHNLLKDSAIDSIESHFQCIIDRVNIKILKHMKFKGTPTACVIRKSKINHENLETTKPSMKKNDQITPIIDQLKEKCHKKQVENNNSCRISINSNNQENQDNSDSDKLIHDYTIPKYTVIHRQQHEMQDFTNQVDSKLIGSTRPKELLITIELPLCKSSQNVSLDIFETRLYLESKEPNYKLDLKLPYPVRENDSKAKFDKSKRCLYVFLTVIKLQSQLEEDYFEFSPFISDSSKIIESFSSNSKLNSVIDKSKVISPETDHETCSVSYNLVSNVKFNLAHKFQLNETKNFIFVKAYIPNFIKDSIKIKFDSESMFTIMCESCSSSGSYIKYYAMSIKFFSTSCKNLENQIDESLSYKIFDLHLIPANFISVNHINNIKMNSYLTVDCNNKDFIMFQLKKKSSKNLDDTNLKTALIDLPIAQHKNDKTEKILIELFQDFKQEENEIYLKEDICLNNEKNKISIKNFILNFKTNVEKYEIDDEDDTDYSRDKLDSNNNVFSEKHSIGKSEDKSNESRAEKEHENNYDRIISNNLISGKIDEEPKLAYLQNYNENLFEDSLSSYQKTINETFDRSNYQKCSRLNEKNEISSLSSSSTNFTNDSSIMGSSFSGNKLKGILKKTRSLSESESTIHSFETEHRNSMPTASQNSIESIDGNSNSHDNIDTSVNKKSVSFNKQVVKNIFKPGSTVTGMRKPNSNKNKRKNEKNKRKRTISDPSHDSSDSNSALRNRSISESSDDSSNLKMNSVESFTNINSSIERKKIQIDQFVEHKLKKKKSKANIINEITNNKINLENDILNELDNIVVENQKIKENDKNKTFNMETMINWKNQGRLPTDEEIKKLNHSTKCSFKFKNKLVNDLD